jgi:hypothetical protein
MLLRFTRFRTGAGLFRSPLPAMRRAFERTADFSEGLCMTDGVLPRSSKQQTNRWRCTTSWNPASLQAMSRRSEQIVYWCGAVVGIAQRSTSLTR